MEPSKLFGLLLLPDCIVGLLVILVIIGTLMMYTGSVRRRKRRAEKRKKPGKVLILVWYVFIRGHAIFAVLN